MFSWLILNTLLYAPRASMQYQSFPLPLSTIIITGNNVCRNSVQERKKAQYSQVKHFINIRNFSCQTTTFHVFIISVRYGWKLLILWENWGFYASSIRRENNKFNELFVSMEAMEAMAACLFGFLWICAFSEPEIFPNNLNNGFDSNFSWNRKILRTRKIFITKNHDVRSALRPHSDVICVFW